MKEKKEYKIKTFAVIAAAAVFAVLAVMTIFAFGTRYTGFSAEKTAVQFADTIAQTGDGYNAYKNTILSQNPKLKYGDFLRRAYMAPFVNEDAEKAEFVGTGSQDEQQKTDALYSEMYLYYAKLLKKYGWDDCDSMMRRFLKKLVKVRSEIYGDKYMDTEFMFAVLEGSVASYGEYLTGSDEVLAADGKTVLRPAVTGLYDSVWGDGWKLTTGASGTAEVTGADLETYKKELGERLAKIVSAGVKKAEKFKAAGGSEEDAQAMREAFEGLDCAADVEEIKIVTVDVLLDGEKLKSVDIPVLKIGSGWYVDNTNIDTTPLYF